MNRLRRAYRSSAVACVVRRSFSVSVVLAAGLGLGVSSLSGVAAADAPQHAVTTTTQQGATSSVQDRKHTGDLWIEAVCNTQTGNYDFTAKLVLTNVPSGQSGSTMWRIGTSEFEGTPDSASGMDKGPISSNGNTTLTLGTWSLPGTTTGYGSWVYAYTKWSPDNYEKGSDGQLKEQLKGDCKSDTPPDACPYLPGDQPEGFQCEPKTEKQTRHIETAPNCKTGASVAKDQERTRTQEFVDGQWVWGEWSKWTTVRATSGTVPPSACKAKVRTHCVTRHWGEGTATLFNKGLDVSKRYHIIRSGKDRVVTVGAHKNRAVDLTGLRVGSIVKIKVDGKVVARDMVNGGCGHTPPPDTGARQAVG